MINDMLAIKVNERAHGEVLRLFHSEVLFVKGMPVTSIYVISKGAILIFSSDGRRVLRWVGRHQLLGINEVLSGVYKFLNIRCVYTKAVMYRTKTFRVKLIDYQRHVACIIGVNPVSTYS